MKKTVLLLLTISLYSNAQSYSFDELQNAERLRDIPTQITEYTASNGQVFKVGEFITFGTPMNENNTYAHIYGFDALGTLSVFDIRDKGFESEIIKFRKAGTKRMGLEILAVSKTKTGLDRAYTSIEKALAEGEIVSTKMTRKQAIDKLKEAKDLFDLGLMEEKDYNALKEELKPIIMAN